MNMTSLAKAVQSQGRNGDSMLVHMTPGEVGGLQALAMRHGGSLTINPQTGLPEADFLKNLLPTLIGAGLMFIPGMQGIGAGYIGAGVGAVETLRTGDLGKGIMAGLGAYGGANLASGAMAAGAASGAGGAGANVATEAVNQSAAETARLAAANEAAAASTNAAMFGDTGLATETLAGGSTLQPLVQTPSAIMNPALSGTAGVPVASTVPTPPPTFTGNVQQAGRGVKNLFSGQEGSFDAFIGNAEREANARKGIEAAEAAGLGGGVGAFKTAGALGAPMIVDALTPEYPTLAPAEEKSSVYEGPYTPTRRDVRYPDDERRRRSSEFMFFTPSNPVPFSAGGGVEEDRAIKMPDASYVAGVMPEFDHNFKPVEVVAPPSPPTVAINLGGGGGGKGGRMVQNFQDIIGKSIQKDADKKTESQTSDLSNYTYDPKTQRLIPNFASGGVPMLEDGGFVLTKKAIDGLGKGNNKKGQQVASAGLGAIPIKGAGAKRGPKAGVDDKIKTSIEGKRPALVSNGEAYVPKRQVSKHGGAKKFYALMDKAEKQAKKTKRA